MRRVAFIAAIGAATLAIAACGGDGEPADGGVVERTRPVPEDVRAFLDRVAGEDDIGVVDYRLLNKNGGVEHTVHVDGATVTIDGEVVDLEDNGALANYGIIAGFMTRTPAALIEATARRADAGDAVFTQRGEMDCIAIPVQGATPATFCLVPDGYFGYVDTPSVRYELVVSG